MKSLFFIAALLLSVSASASQYVYLNKKSAKVLSVKEIYDFSETFEKDETILMEEFPFVEGELLFLGKQRSKYQISLAGQVPYFVEGTKAGGGSIEISETIMYKTTKTIALSKAFRKYLKNNTLDLSVKLVNTTGDLIFEALDQPENYRVLVNGVPSKIHNRNVMKKFNNVDEYTTFKPSRNTTYTLSVENAEYDY